MLRTPKLRTPYIIIQFTQFNYWFVESGSLPTHSLEWKCNINWRSHNATTNCIVWAWVHGYTISKLSRILVIKSLSNCLVSNCQGAKAKSFPGPGSKVMSQEEALEYYIMYCLFIFSFSKVGLPCWVAVQDAAILDWLSEGHATKNKSDGLFSAQKLILIKPSNHVIQAIHNNCMDAQPLILWMEKEAWLLLWEILFWKSWCHLESIHTHLRYM